MRKLFVGVLAQAATATILLSSTALAADSANVLEAGIVHGALVAGQVGGSLATLAQGGTGRGLPAISPDGTRIAFVQATDKRVALADTVVIAMNGRELARIAVEPASATVAYAGMQYVEGLRWISPSRIAIRGSINPSQSQYYVIDVAAGKVVEDFTDDASSAAFSPDGLHVASLSESPHYTPSGGRAPVLSVDDKAVWQAPAGATLASVPQFSPDGASLAWAARDAVAKPTLYVWNGRALQQAAIPAAADAALSVSWSGVRPVVMGRRLGRKQAWSLQANGGMAPELAVDSTQAANALHDKLVRQAHTAGVNEPDFWCASCSLAVLPRGSE